jgi:hypothetical protein
MADPQIVGHDEDDIWGPIGLRPCGGDAARGSQQEGEQERQMAGHEFLASIGSGGSFASIVACAAEASKNRMPGCWSLQIGQNANRVINAAQSRDLA